MRQLFQFLRNLVFWSYSRGTLPYDLLCGAILIFIFLTPRSFFKDWPTWNNPHQFQLGEQIVRTLDDKGNPVINVSAAWLLPAGDSRALKLQAQTRLLQVLGKDVHIANIQPILGDQGKTIGYTIWLAEENVTN